MAVQLHPSPQQLYYSRDWGRTAVGPLVPNSPQIVTELRGSPSRLNNAARRGNIQRSTGACVKVVGVQSGSLSHSLQNRPGPTCAHPSRALFDIQGAQTEVKVFQDHEDGYVIISVRSSPPAL